MLSWILKDGEKYDKIFWYKVLINHSYDEKRNNNISG